MGYSDLLYTGMEGWSGISLWPSFSSLPAGFVNANSKEELLSLFGSLRDEVTATYDPDGNTDFGEMLTLINTDKVWAEPARFTAKAFVAKGLPVYLYLFSYVPASLKERMRYGAVHGSEIPYVFDNLRDRNGFTVGVKDQEVARMMNTYWANFAKTGDPNGMGLPHWQVYDPLEGEVFEFRQVGSAGSAPDHRKARLDVIEKASTKNFKYMQDLGYGFKTSSNVCRRMFEFL
jgi:para-nitrobenzyl esterase